MKVLNKHSNRKDFFYLFILSKWKAFLNSQAVSMLKKGVLENDLKKKNTKKKQLYVGMVCELLFPTTNGGDEAERRFEI